MYLTNRKNFKSDNIVLQQWDKHVTPHALSESKFRTITENKWASCRDNDIPIYSKTYNPSSGHAPQTNSLNVHQQMWLMSLQHLVIRLFIS